MPKKSTSSQQNDHHHWILHEWFRLGTKTHFQKRNCGSEFATKGYFPSKKRKVNITIDFCILKLASRSKLTILIFWNKFSPKKSYFWSKARFWSQIFPTRVFPVENKSSEYYNWVLHLRISLSTTFQLKLTGLGFFWSKFSQKHSSPQLNSPSSK